MTLRTIHRYKVAGLGVTSLDMPKGATIVDAGIHKAGWQILASHVLPNGDTPVAMESRNFAGIKTGQPYPADAAYLTSFLHPSGCTVNLVELSAGALEDYQALYPVIDEAIAEQVTTGN